MSTIVENSVEMIKTQFICESDLSKILTFHQCRFGWAYLLDNTLADLAAGFPCWQEERFIREQLKHTKSETSEWFRTVGATNNWPSRKGWTWEIDFENGKAIPIRERNHPHPDSPNSENLVPGPIMKLGDIDLAIFKHLIESRGGLADLARSRIQRFINNNMTLHELIQIVQQLGAAEIDVKDWFYHMAKIYKWPQPEDGRFQYRVSMSDKYVFLEFIINKSNL